VRGKQVWVGLDDSIMTWSVGFTTTAGRGASRLAGRDTRKAPVPGCPDPVKVSSHTGEGFSMET
jgi:hypothetical protein